MTVLTDLFSMKQSSVKLKGKTVNLSFIPKSGNKTQWIGYL